MSVYLNEGSIINLYHTNRKSGHNYRTVCVRTVRVCVCVWVISECTLVVGTVFVPCSEDVNVSLIFFFSLFSAFKKEDSGFDEVSSKPVKQLVK